MEIRTSNGNRRGPIPRPWLTSKHQYVPPIHSPQYRYTHPFIPGTAVAAPDILDKHDWKVSWEKLSCCFCLRPSSTKPPHDQRRLSAYDPSTGGRRSSHHQPYDPFPFLRRNSSSSFLENQNDVYPSSGSVSSFTESDTSSSEDSDDHVKHKNAAQRNHITAPHPSTPPPVPVTQKPPTVSNRSRSLGLPPIDPSSSNLPNTPQPSMVRKRLDTGDFTGYSGTTTTSRHRRRQQYEFSNRSMGQIWRGASVEGDKLVLPSYVVCQDEENPASNSNDSGYISALDDSSDWGTQNSSSHGFYDGDEDEPNIGTQGSFRYSPSSQMERKMADHGWKQRRDERPPKAAPPANRQEESRRSRKSHTHPRASRPPKKKLESVVVPVYLRKNASMDNMAEGNLVVSGWVAAFFGDDTFEEKAQKGSKGLHTQDIFYLQIVDNGDSGANVLLHSSTGAIKHTFPLQREWMCESREISSRIGRCVTVRSRTSPSRVIANLLPVSLDNSFFKEDALIPPQKFCRQNERLFAIGNGKVFAPDEQHDAATYIMFSLDALITNYVR